MPRGQLPGGVVDRVEGVDARAAVQQRVGGRVGDRELGLQRRLDVVVAGGLARHRVGEHDERAVGHAVDTLRALDRAVGLEAAGPRLDPVALDRPRAVAGLGPLAAVGVAPGGGDALERHRRARGRELCGGDAGRRREPDLQRLAVGAERGAQAARAQGGERRGGVGGCVEQRGGRDRRADAAADRGRVPAAVVERRDGPRGRARPSPRSRARRRRARRRRWPRRRRRPRSPRARPARSGARCPAGRCRRSRARARRCRARRPARAARRRPPPPRAPRARSARAPRTPSSRAAPRGRARSGPVAGAAAPAARGSGPDRAGRGGRGRLPASPNASAISS